MTLAGFIILESASAAAFGFAARAAARRCGVEFGINSRAAMMLIAGGTLAAGGLCAAGSFTSVTASHAVLFAAASICAATDAVTGFVFDAVTLPALAFLALSAYHGGTIREAALGTACAAGAILLIYAATRGRGIGLGDAKLAACIGAGLGARASLDALGVAFVAGACAGLAALIMRRASRKSEMRFAPYLAAGTLAAALWQAA